MEDPKRIKTRTENLHIGLAGWTIAKEHSRYFPDKGTHLERYARQFSVVEINTTFYRLHKPETYQKWAAAVPDDFRFAVKMPRAITHYGKLKNLDVLPDFLDGVAQLGDKAGPVLVQTPPSLTYDQKVAQHFFSTLREAWEGHVVFEPRHLTWFVGEAEMLLREHRVARVAADPAKVPDAAYPGGWPGLAYYRLHGSPKIYYSSYPAPYLDKLSSQLHDLSEDADVWCIFDNTASGAAYENARYVMAA